MRYSKEVKEMEKKILNLKKELIQKEVVLKFAKKKELSDEYGITIGKTIVIYRGNEYRVSRIEIYDGCSGWIFGRKKLKNGNWSKTETHLPNWEVTE